MVKDLSNIIREDIFTSGYIYELRNRTVYTVDIGIRNLNDYRSDIVSRMMSGGTSKLPGLLILGRDTSKPNQEDIEKSFNKEIIPVENIPDTSSFSSNSISSKYFKE